MSLTTDGTPGPLEIVGPRAGRVPLSLASVLALVCIAQIGCGLIGRRSSTLPAELSDREFWELSASLSEAPGTFGYSDNLVSNEIRYAHLARTLEPRGGVYVGVGPEQNFSYIARLEPAMAFIIDIRQENRNLHLLYKALFELSADRADFLSHLFSRERPAAATATATAQHLFELYDRVKAGARLFQVNLQLVRDHLVDLHGFALSSNDLAWIEHALRSFFLSGPDVHYGPFGASESPGPSYRTLMTVADVGGHNRSYLASEESFAFIKDLHRRNMIVLVVGDFAGTKAVRGVGAYVRQHGAVVETFYASNVEVFLNRQQNAAFCGNLLALPYDSGAWFIGSKAMQRVAAKLKGCPGIAVE